MLWSLHLRVVVHRRETIIPDIRYEWTHSDYERWQKRLSGPKFDKDPAGEYEYIDAICERGTSHGDRLIVDIDFRSQFKIVRPRKSYIDLTACLPLIFVGSAEKLSQVLRILAEEAKLSLKNNKMYVSPRRSLST
ncbi:hypothetical protein KP509_01G087100 [Ceratopteris richardii]|uniref:Uncharacterized protein n=1 Tax=Ceratopteris richardii TaxID=49495 RepID=A0A8T2VEX9_CERRI|nr:hypothetical protein KP509_01G087100 [Ceratopteris richardii]